MAGPFNGTIFLGTADAGWTMNVYPDGVDYGTAMQALQAVNSALMPILPSNVICRNLRVSDLTQRKDVLNAAPEQPHGTYGGTGGPALPTDPALAMTQTFIAGPFHQFRLFLRGMPNIFVDSTDPMTMKWTNSDWDPGYAVWLTAMKDNCQFVWKQRPPAPQFTTFTITDYVRHPASVPIPLSIRKAGRPFGLRRGRRLV